LANSTTSYKVTNISGDLPIGSSPYELVGINNSGQVVGCYNDEEGIQINFLWDRKSGIQTIHEGLSFGLSDNGYVIGDFGVWKNGSIVNIGTLGGQNTNVSAISSGGKIVGTSQVSTGEWHTFLWDEVDGMRDLGVINGSIIAINDNDEMAGEFRSTNYEMHSFFWNEISGMIDIGTLGGSCYAEDLNIHGQMTGSSGGNLVRPYLWEDLNNNGISDSGERISLGTLGNPGCYGQGINDNGQVVGYSDVMSGTTHGFIWDELNGMIDLNDCLVGEDGWEFHHAIEINNNGEIIGYATNPDNNYAFILLTPVVCTAPVAGDLNDDCKVDFADFAVMATHWLDCNLEPKEACWQ
jgi:probable HAF family extracellular repeat protein